MGKASTYGSQIWTNYRSKVKEAGTRRSNPIVPGVKEVTMASGRDFYALDLCESDAHLCSPQEQFCPKDGSRVVRKCQKCTQKVGEWRVMGSPPTGNVPQHCFNCGESFPWARRR